MEIRREADLAPLRTAWDELVRSSGSDTIFLTWEWVATWWSAYGSPGDLRVLTVLDDHGVLRGIAPCRCQSVRGYGQTVHALSFIGDSSIEDRPSDSDYLDFIVAPGYEKQVLEAVLNYWADTLSRGAVLLLNETPAGSPNLPALQELADGRGMTWRETDVPCATIQLPGSWDDYLRILQPRFRTKVRSVLRNLESQPEVQFRFCENAGQLERILPALFDLHTRRWAEEGKPGVFYWDRKRNFYLGLSRLLLERHWLRLSWLEWNGQVLACQYGFAYGGAYSQLQEGYEPASEHWNPGIGLRAWSIREFLKEGLREYDFLGGVGRHKTTWGAEVKQSKRIMLAFRSSRNLLFRCGPDWEVAVRAAVRKTLPAGVLQLAQRKGNRSPGLPTENSSDKGWARHAAAEFYVRSGLPALTRRLRTRYQLSTGKKISWSRRAQSSARILYYHRVNDEKDPFLGAISTDLFEQQMRYLARHYNVVSMGDLMRHLAEDSDDAVVAITFDDGYLDNYENAFPILSRYGLPATVFLTTGSLDSDASLWFEELAEAIKRTGCEHIDLEIDIPRRFWMRTLAERIDSNRQIFGLLRRLDDTGRRQWLPQILRQLRVAEMQDRQNGMLTWDQVRLMKAHGIDFGGHTVTHPFLSKLAPSEAAWEITECKRRIEQELQQTVEYFAYPNGREEDFSSSTKDLLRAAGYRAAVTTIWGMNYRSTDPWELRRGQPWETSSALFATKLDWYQLVNQ
jgi:peptidoglycan/xylan/chitin deacetylase (PgdA/CDA1 family)/CelD/BcsL family acetyltransferase involved in cellulose biosynthesis